MYIDDHKKYPDPHKHFTISMYKSALRIGAATSLAFSMFILAGVLFIFAEVLGIIEELV